MNEMFELEGVSPVSYTHLTLPTYTSGPCCLIFRIQDLWTALASDF